MNRLMYDLCAWFGAVTPRSLDYELHVHIYGKFLKRVSVD